MNLHVPKVCFGNFVTFLLINNCRSCLFNQTLLFFLYMSSISWNKSFFFSIGTINLLACTVFLYLRVLHDSRASSFLGILWPVSGSKIVENKMGKVNPQKMPEKNGGTGGVFICFILALLSHFCFCSSKVFRRKLTEGSFQTSKEIFLIFCMSKNSLKCY